MAPSNTITLTEAAEILGVGYRRARQLLAAGEFKARRDPKTGRLLVSLKSVLKLKRQRDNGEKRSWRRRPR